MPNNQAFKNKMDLYSIPQNDHVKPILIKRHS